VRSADLARWIAGSAAGLAVAFAPVARADEGCATVVPAKGLPTLWTVALDELRAQIARLAGSECQPMTLSVEPVDGYARVVATTRDGRRAERIVRRPESLVPTALGLLMAIPEQAPPASASPAAPPSEPDGTRSLTEAARTRPTTSIPLPVPPAVSSIKGVWTGLSAGLRLTAPTAVTVVDVEARADILFERWLLFTTIRSAVVSCLGQQGLDCDVYTDVSAGAGVGRRVRTGTAAIDVGLEPSVVVMHMEYDLPRGSEGQPLQGTLVALRLDASARLALPLGPSWALTVTIDGGLAPTILASPTSLPVPAGTGGSDQPPPFPAWTGAVRVGATGALL